MKSGLEKDLERAAGIVGAAERAVSVAAVVSEALGTVRQKPVLVGGSAVAFYTEGGYATADIDMVSEGGPDLVKVMTGLGFEKIGKDFVQKRLKIYIEFPSPALKPSEKTSLLRIGGRSLRIISIEDLIVDRLSAFKFWQSGIDGVSALMLLESGEIDEKRLAVRAREDEVLDALLAVGKVREQAIRKKLPPGEASDLLERKMRRLAK